MRGRAFDELGKYATNGHDIVGPPVIKIATTVESAQINTRIRPHEQGPVVYGAADVEMPRAEGQRTDRRRDKAVKVARLGGVIRVLVKHDMENVFEVLKPIGTPKDARAPYRSSAILL